MTFQNLKIGIIFIPIAIVRSLTLWRLTFGCLALYRMTYITRFLYVSANAGGLLGLCMGFSFLSIVEIIYFVTLRVICTHSHDQIQKFIKRRGKSRFDNKSVYPFIKWKWADINSIISNGKPFSLKNQPSTFERNMVWNRSRIDKWKQNRDAIEKSKSSLLCIMISL